MKNFMSRSTIKSLNGRSPLRLGGIGRVFRAGFHRRIVIVDFPEYELAGMVERSEIVLAVRIVVVGEFVVLHYLRQDRGLVQSGQGGDAQRL
jgi:hypothetical protein